MKQICKELIDFFNNSEGWDKQGLIDEFIEKVLGEDLKIEDTNITFVTCDNRNEDLILQQTVARIIEEIRYELHCHFIDDDITINMLGKDLDTFLDKILVRYHTYADR